MKLIFATLCLLPMMASAAPILQGTLESSGASVNNTTTATAFTPPLGPTLIQCDADSYIYYGENSSASATSTNGMKIFADEKLPATLTNNRKVIAIKPVTGSANCKVFALYNETISFARISGSGAEPCGTSDSCYAISYYSTINTGAEGYICTATGWCFDPGPGTGNSIGVDNDANIVLGDGTREIIIGSNHISNNQIFVVNGAVNFNNSLLRDLVTGYLQIASRFEIQSQTLGPCPRVNGTMPLVYETGSGGTSTKPTRLCACVSDGFGNYVWYNMLNASFGDNTTCPS